ncbi:MAG: hypothetical protein J3K34DRAFT_474850 [Monoraphidium minutum]|nr:MAG: hypothetical protein J3K34DRAFT_474850 [Monoraphidium minutum]
MCHRGHPAARAAAPRRAAAALALVAALALLAAAALPAAAAAPKPVSRKARTRVVRAVNLSDVPGCGDSQELTGGLGTACVFEAAVGPDEDVTLLFDVSLEEASAGPAMGTFDLMAQLRTVAGAARMKLVAPGGAEPPKVDRAGSTLYSTLFATNEFVAVAAEFLEANPGAWALNITTAADDVAFVRVTVHTPLATVLLDADELAVVEEIGARCCQGAAANRSPLCKEYLPAVTAPGRPPGVDMCRMPPVTCDEDGHMRQLSLPGAGLDCGGLGLPPSVANLSRLEVLDVAFNDIGGTTAALGGILRKLPNLKRAYLRRTNITGGLLCALAEGPALQTLSVAGNAGITGAVPSCLLDSPTLEEVFISDTGLSGLLPDVIKPDSPLRILFAVGPGADSGREPLSGALPASLGNAGKLEFLDVSGNGFEGPITALPPSLLWLDASRNAFTQLPAQLPAGLRVLQASGNRLGGAAPPIGPALERLVLDGNALEGAMPAFEGIQARRRLQGLGRRLAQEADDTASGFALRYVSLSRNRLSGPLPDDWATVPENLRYLAAADNALGSALPTEWNLPALEVLDLAGNQLTGSLPPELGEQQEIVTLDLSRNLLSGGLGPFAISLADNEFALESLNLSDNYLSGPIPVDLADINILEPYDVPDPINDEPLPPESHLIDLSGNAFSGGPFPLWLLDEIPDRLDTCIGCALTVKVNGPKESLACPTEAEGAEYLDITKPTLAVLRRYNFECTNAEGVKVPLLGALNGSSPGAREVRSVDVPAAPGGGGGGGGSGSFPFSGMKPGLIAAIVGGVIGGVALLVVALVIAARMTRHRRKGYAKEDLDGGGTSEFGGATVYSGPPPHNVCCFA